MAISAESLLPFTWRSSAATTRGNVRPHNEDAVLELPQVGLWAVADGLGGHNGGDIASRMLVEALAEVTPRALPSEFVNAVEDCLRAVNQRLFEAGLETDRGLSGTTAAVLLAFGDYALSIWAGDSRIYRLRGGSFECVTHDHSEVQALLDEGVISAADALQHENQNVITRAVGVARDLFLDLELRKLQPDDRYLLCTDGLYRELSEGQLAAHMSGEDPEETCSDLLAQALNGTCADNASAVVVHFGRGAGDSTVMPDERTQPPQARP